MSSSSSLRATIVVTATAAPPTTRAVTTPTPRPADESAAAEAATVTPVAVVPALTVTAADVPMTAPLGPTICTVQLPGGRPATEYDPFAVVVVVATTLPLASTI